ncbi:MAG: hypothetical protein HRT80_00910 [Henriciella sp.]|nr:hypothetical protein [Henriciella sp.]
MMRSIVGAIGLLFLVGSAAAQNLFYVTPEKTLQDVPVVIEPDGARVMPKYTKDSAIKIRVKACVQSGTSSKNCQCRAETSASILKEKDFYEETWYLETGNESGLRFFHNRMLKEQPKLMLRLGNALKSCPASIMRLE